MLRRPSHASECREQNVVNEKGLKVGLKQVKDCMTELIECAAYALKSLTAMRLLDGDGYDVTPTGYRGIQHTLGNWTKDSCLGGRDNRAGVGSITLPF